MGKKRLLAVAVSAVAVMGVGASAAAAGEVTGSGKTLWTNTEVWDAPHVLNGKSECAFSGRNDENVLFAPTDPLYQSQRTQTPKDGPFPGVAGYACNPVGKRSGPKA